MIIVVAHILYVHIFLDDTLCSDDFWRGLSTTIDTRISLFHYLVEMRGNPGVSRQEFSTLLDHLDENEKLALREIYGASGHCYRTVI